MNLKRYAWLVLPVVLLAVVGCSQADSNKPISEIKAEVEGMSVSQLESKAKAYAKEIEKKSGDMKQVQEKLKQLSPKELLGDKAKSIKDDISKVSTEVKALTERYNIYASQFRKAGGDVSKIKI